MNECNTLETGIFVKPAPSTYALSAAAPAAAAAAAAAATTAAADAAATWLRGPGPGRRGGNNVPWSLDDTEALVKVGLCRLYLWNPCSQRMGLSA